MLHARPFAVEHDGGAGTQDPRGLLAAAVGKPPRIDPSKPGKPLASAGPTHIKLQPALRAGLTCECSAGVVLPLAFGRYIKNSVKHPVGHTHSHCSPRAALNREVACVRPAMVTTLRSVKCSCRTPRRRKAAVLPRQ